MDSGLGSSVSVSDVINNDLSSDPDTPITSSEVFSSNLSRDPPPNTSSSEAIDLGAVMAAICGSLNNL